MRVRVRTHRLIVLGLSIALCSLVVAWLAWAIQQVTP